MMLESDGNQVLAAFDYILEELPKSCFNLVKEMADAAENGDYDAVTGLTERLMRADVVKGELERLRGEWQWVFNLESVSAELLESPAFGGDAAVIVPGRYELCNPTLQALRDLGGPGRNGDIRQRVIEQMQLPEEVIWQPHKGGDRSQTELESELGWARSTLKTCGMLVNPQPGVGFWQLTEAGNRQKELMPDEWEILWRRCHYGD